MTSAAQTVRLRRQRRRRATGGGMPGAALLAVVSVAVLSLGGVVVAGGRAVLAAAAGLPPASSLETFFGPQGRERFRPAQLFDRSGTVLLAEVIHPLAQDRQWRSLDSLPQAVRQATVASLDSTFWTNPGYNPSAAARALARSVVGGASPEAPRTITEMVARQALVGGSSPALAGMLLAGDIAAAYPKERVLEWFLNSADYGNLAFGIDAAARVYLGKPATDLTLAEAAMLAALPGHPEVDPLAEPAAARALQEEVLQSLRAQGFITAAEQRAAQTQPINLRREEARQAMQGLGFVETVWQELRTRLGAGAAQSGIRVITTLDLDLQLQADCVARSYLERMSGGDPTSVLPAADGSPCAAASLLPPIRPGDSGIDHGIDGAATVLLDPASGEVLALTGPAGEPHAAGSILTPFVVLSALSRGYTPATMVIDSSGSAAGGPMRLRTALAEDNGDVTGQLLRALGGDVVESTLDSIGLGLAGGEQVGEADTRVRLDELTAAFGLLANRGVQAGAVSPGDQVEASTLRAVFSAEGKEMYRLQPARRSVISEGLAYLLNDMLSDEAARPADRGASSPLAIGRPAASVTSAQTGGTWTIGYTPQIAAGVWVGADEGGRLQGIGVFNGAAPIWHALLRYATRSLPPDSWPRPEDVSEVEVCDPSGFLPTAYCPRTVREVFLAGTEPTHSDTLFRPFRINKETGRLATYFTPLDQVQEIVYFVPPPEAAAWATASGLAAPPTEYDRVLPPATADADVKVRSPEFFSIVGGEVGVIGRAAGDGFASYRLDVGEGLDPRQWLQIGKEQATPVADGLLGRWDTSGWNGAAILRLTVVHGDGTVETAAVPVTVDNRPPTVELLLPVDGAEFSPASDPAVTIQAEATDETMLDHVVLLVDGRVVLSRDAAPWSMHWPLGAAGEHTVRARACDAAGNCADSAEVTIRVVR